MSYDKISHRQQEQQPQSDPKPNRHYCPCDCVSCEVANHSGVGGTAGHCCLCISLHTSPAINGQHSKDQGHSSGLGESTESNTGSVSTGQENIGNGGQQVFASNGGSKQSRYGKVARNTNKCKACPKPTLCPACPLRNSANIPL